MTVKGLTTPLLRWLRGFICLCRFEGLVRGLLLNWYLGSQKLREILTLHCCITLSSSRENQRSAQEVARRISGAVAGEAYARSSQDLDSRQRAISGAVAGESMQKSTYQVPIANPYLPHYIICHLPLVFLSPTSPLPFFLALLHGMLIMPITLLLNLYHLVSHTSKRKRFSMI